MPVVECPDVVTVRPSARHECDLPVARTEFKLDTAYLDHAFFTHRAGLNKSRQMQGPACGLSFVPYKEYGDAYRVLKCSHGPEHHAAGAAATLLVPDAGDMDTDACGLVRAVVADAKRERHAACCVCMSEYDNTEPARAIMRHNPYWRVCQQCHTTDNGAGAQGIAVMTNIKCTLCGVWHPAAVPLFEREEADMRERGPVFSWASAAAGGRNETVIRQTAATGFACCECALKQSVCEEEVARRLVVLGQIPGLAKRGTARFPLVRADADRFGKAEGYAPAATQLMEEYGPAAFLLRADGKSSPVRPREPYVPPAWPWASCAVGALELLLRAMKKNAEENGAKAVVRGAIVD